ncbi:MAG: hypothetical protein CL824_03875 [Crocinitomicaceae bacterium]|nr:hypothetical protein [Crocinitomicaceae bacterium]
MKCSLISIILLCFLFACKSPKDSKQITYKLTSNNDTQLYTKYFHEGIRFKLSNRFDEAITSFENAIKISPEKDAPYHALSACYLAKGIIDKSVYYTEKSSELDPRNIFYIEELAYMYKELKKYDLSIKNFKLLLEKDSRNKGWIYDCSNVLSLANKYDEAIEMLDVFESLNGKHPEISITKFKLHITIKQKEKAINEINAALKIYPNNPQLISILIDHHLQNKNYEEGFKMLSNLVKVDPKNGFAQNMLGEWKESQKDLKSAWESYKNAILGKYEVQEKIRLLIKLTSFINIPESKKQLDATATSELDSLIKYMIKNSPEIAQIHAIQGDFNYLLGNKKEALKSFKNTIALDPSHYAVWNEIFVIEEELNMYQELYTDSKNAIEFFPSMADVYLYNGWSAFRLNKHDEAIEVLESGIIYLSDEDRTKKEWKFYTYISDAYFAKNDYINALKYIKSAYTSRPNNYLVNKKYAHLLISINSDLELASSITSLLIKETPDDCEIINLKGFLLFQQKKYNEALNMFLKHLDKQKCKVKTLEFIGDSYYMLDNIQGALDNWNKANQIGKQNKLLERKINERKFIPIVP